MNKAVFRSLFLLLVASAVAAANNPISNDACADDWTGFVDTSISDFAILVNLRRSDGDHCIGTISIPDQSVVDAPLRDVKIDNDVVSFSTVVRGSKLEFRGAFSAGMQRIDGQLRQGSLNLPFKLARGSTALLRSDAEPLRIVARNVEGLPSDRASIAPPDHPAIRYTTTLATDVVAGLNSKIADGKVSLSFDGPQGYLRSTLNALKVPVESQMLVFSKTSVQAHLITPSNPRALYFRDDVTVGFIRNAPFIELAALDPKQGIVFYTLSQTESPSPRFVRRNDCLSCHLSRNTMDVPGLRLRSVVTGSNGRTFDQYGDYRVDDRTPFEERWGGWYVTGTVKSAMHLGNAMILDGTGPEGLIKPENLSLTSLTNRFATDAYPLPTSDIAALMVYEHQAQMTNILIRVAWDARAASYLKQPASRELTAKLLANNAREVVDYMLFADEVSLPGRVAAISSFADTFSAQGPRDKKGRSLRQLDLQTRLMRYPCSYMIYSSAFDALPVEAKSAVYQRMWQVLSGIDKAPKYNRLSGTDRQNVIEILRDTKSDLPVYFK